MKNSDHGGRDALRAIVSVDLTEGYHVDTTQHAGDVTIVTITAQGVAVRFTLDSERADTFGDDIIQADFAAPKGTDE